MLISLVVVVISQCMPILRYHIIHLRYIQFVSHFSHGECGNNVRKHGIGKRAVYFNCLQKVRMAGVPGVNREMGRQKKAGLKHGDLWGPCQPV